ncbi:hypothetical protein ACHAWO_008736 [Cyclotella atomus]|uniref:Helicase-associated domain-containing protein n=1 Tax=Cyclotella atomus TaxID=382360 RepID=A0ABD3NJW2_9STRA
MFAFLDYIKEHDNALVPKNHKTKDGVSLGAWVLKIRRDFEDKNKNLSPQRIQMLNDVGFVWELSYEWSNLLLHFNKHGDALVPVDYKDNPSLGNWVDVQRREFKAGNRSKERIQLLNKVKFVWHPCEDQWLERYKELVQYFSEHGNALVPRGYKKNPELGNWVNEQRAKRIQRLNAVRFEWDVLEAQWFERYEELVQYINIHGNALVPQTY